MEPPVVIAVTVVAAIGGAVLGIVAGILSLGHAAFFGVGAYTAGLLAMTGPAKVIHPLH